MKVLKHWWTAALLACPAALGAEFDNEDINNPATEGSTTVDGDTITVVGGGNDIWGTADMFQFYYATFQGSEDFDAVVQVISLEGTHHWAKAELMARNGGGSEFAEPGDPHISLMATRTGGQNQISPQWREVRDGGSGWNGGNVVSPVPYPDVHFRLTKSGSVISSFFSEDGESWQLMYRADTSDPDAPVHGKGSGWTGEDYGASDTTVHLGLAVTSHDDNPDVVATAVFRNFRLLSPKAPTVTADPVNASVLAGAPVEFSVEVSGDASPPPEYQWTRNGQDIAGATGSVLSMDRASIADNGAAIAVRVSNSAGSVTSGAATLTVTPDTEPPTIVSAEGHELFETIRITFSEPLDPASAATASNYTLSEGVQVRSAALGGEPGSASDHTVVLETSEQPIGTSLTLSVANVKDAAGGNPVASGTQHTFTTHIWVSGVVLHRYWQNINTRVPSMPGGHGVPSQTFAALRTLAEFPNSPDGTTLQPRWEFPPNGGGNMWDQYCNQISGWFMPPATDDYVFFTNSDDPSALYLSPDNDPANKLLIAQQINWAGARQWQAGDDNQKRHKRSDWFTDVYDVEQEYAEDIWEDFTTDWGITLEAGERYYLESLSREAGGGDNHAVTFITVDEAVELDAPPANGDAPALTGDVIGVFLNPNGTSVTFASQPQDTSVVQGRPATFSVVAEATSAYGTDVAYQWETAAADSDDWTEIDGATGSSYTTGILNLGDTGTRYRVNVGATALNLYSVHSASAAVNVTQDTVPPMVLPHLTSAAGDSVFIAFDERMDRGSVETASNYTVTGTGVSSVQLVGAEENIAWLTLGGDLDSNASVVVSNVEDAYGNAIATTTVGNLHDVLAYWDFDEERSGTVYGQARAIPAQMMGSAAFSADGEGRSGSAGDRAMDFGARANGAYLRVEPADFFNLVPHTLDQITIAFWQKWSQVPAAQSAFWAFSPSSGGGGRGLQAHTPWNAAGAIYFDTVGCCNGATQRINSGNYDVLSEEVDYQEWNHFAFTKSGSLKEIWINGEIFHEGENTSVLPGDITRLSIGSADNGGNSHGGWLDDFAIFGTALSEADIVSLAEGKRPDEIRDFVPIEPQLDDATIGIAFDSQGRVMIEYTGTLYSSGDVAGPFEAVAGAASPYSPPGDAGPMFYYAR